jgi:hypothetical protein
MAFESAANAMFILFQAFQVVEKNLGRLGILVDLNF